VLNDFGLIIYGLIGTGIFAFSSNDFREILKAVAKARKSLNQVSKESTQLLTQAALSAPEYSNKDLMLLKMANNFGVVTRGKTREQLTEEINVKVRKLSS
jgi:hypothetical protein